jgi:hypothetical protein
MTTPRRRLLRPDLPPPSTPPNSIQLQKLRCKLAKEHAGLARWLTRLKRAVNAVAKHQRRLARLERQIARLEGG